ncbi:hypothetical protein RI129_005675 [Pyrocoelia pectoralis]|uniref:Regulatory protein zeste n=1 Tax=Pyrocoelia pectoralis TaxID=417401 RepID=A0AAN7ZFK3_9COLE
MEQIEVSLNQQQKRKRAPNFTPDEQLLCLNIIKKYKSIIENKKTNSVTLKEKEETWNKISTEYNSCSPVGLLRTADNLKKLYENKKKETRKYAANEKREILLTGGGKIKLFNDPTLEATLDIINPNTVFGLNTKFGDGRNPVQTSSDIEVVQSNEDYTAADIAEAVIDWGDYKASHLQTPLNEKLEKVSERSIDPIATPSTSAKKTWSARRHPNLTSTSSLASKYEKLADLKIEVAQNQLKFMKQQEERQQQQAARREEREEEEFLLRKESMKLDIKLKKIQFEKLNDL